MNSKIFKICLCIITIFAVSQCPSSTNKQPVNPSSFIISKVDNKSLKAVGASQDNSSSQSSKYSDADVNLLARIISAESRGEPYSGQVAVGAVILNRIEHPSFPDTLSGVIYQPGAFSCLADGQVNEPVDESAKKAARDAINGMDPSGGAIYYYNPEKTSNSFMLSRPVITTIGKHKFCS